MSAPAVVGLGGGHGLAVTLGAVRRYAGEITAVVSAADDGGSSGRIRRDFGLPAPGDIRRCLVALAEHPDDAWARAFGSRFEGGDVDGHVLGNLVITALVEATGSFVTAVDEAARLLGCRGRVLPATLEPVVLTARSEEEVLVGQRAIEEHRSPIVSVGIDPIDAKAPREALEAIATADQIVLGPGSLFTSVLAVLAVPDIRCALRGRNLIFVANLHPPRELPALTVADHLAALGRHGVVPRVVVADESVELGAVAEATRVVSARLAERDGLAHDPRRLARSLAEL